MCLDEIQDTAADALEDRVWNAIRALPRLSRSWLDGVDSDVAGVSDMRILEEVPSSTPNSSIAVELIVTVKS